MTRRFLFRVNLGDKCGLGHFMRCVSLAEEVLKKRFGDVLFLLNHEMRDNVFLKQFNLPIEFNENEKKTLNLFKPTAIIIDINYLAPDVIEHYREWAPVTNLAPRGMPKFYADATFNRMIGLDVSPPQDAYDYVHFRGPEYTIVGTQYKSIREKLYQLSEKWNRRKIIVCMGGVDQINMTETVLEDFIRIEEDIEINVILGPLHPYCNRLEKLISGNHIKIIIDPVDIAREIVKSSVGIFGMGVLTYEALSIGVPSINIGPSSFHDIVAKELLSKGVIIYAGNYDEKKSLSIRILLSNLMSQIDAVESMRNKGLKLIDGKGTERVVNKIIELFG